MSMKMMTTDKTKSCTSDTDNIGKTEQNNKYTKQ